MACIDDSRENDTPKHHLDRDYTAICIGERYNPSVRDTEAEITVVTYFLLIHPKDETKNQWKRVGLGVAEERRRASDKEKSEMFRDSERKEFVLI